MWFTTLPYLQGTASTTPPINGNAKSGVCPWTSKRCPWTFCPIPPASHFGPIMPTTLGKTTPPGRASPDQAKEQTGSARRRARQSIREYELIWLLQQRLRAVSWPHWRLRCMQPLMHSHCMGVVRPCSLSRGDPSAFHARFMCSAPAFYVLGAACR